MLKFTKAEKELLRGDGTFFKLRLKPYLSGFAESFEHYLFKARIEKKEPTLRQGQKAEYRVSYETTEGNIREEGDFETLGQAIYWVGRIIGSASPALVATRQNTLWKEDSYK